MAQLIASVFSGQPYSCLTFLSIPSRNVVVRFHGKAGKGKDSSEDSGDYDDNCVDIDDEDDSDEQKGERVTWQKRRVSAPAAALQLTAVQATLGE